MKLSDETTSRIAAAGQSGDEGADRDTPRRVVSLFPAKPLKSSIEARARGRARCRVPRQGSVGGFSRLQMHVAPALNRRMLKLLGRRLFCWLKNASALTASLLGVGFVTLSIGFTGLNPLDELQAKHHQSVSGKRVREAAAAMIPLVRDAGVSKVSVASRLAQDSIAQPLFGPLAVEACHSWCQAEPGMSAALCEAGCGRLSLEEYGRRITVSGLAPEDDAKQIAARCGIDRAAVGTEGSRAAWEGKAKRMLELFARGPLDRPASLTKVKVSQSRLLRLSRSIQLPPEATAADRMLTQRLAEAACLRVNLSLADMGFLMAEHAGDTVSKDYYQRFAAELRPFASKGGTHLAATAKAVWAASA